MNPFPSPLEPATLLRRYKRFLADVALPNGEIETVHCANPGAMTTCCEAGRDVLLSRSANPGRKLPLTLEMIRMPRAWVGVNTAVANRVVAHWLRSGRLFPGCGEVRAEARTQSSRFDFLLGGETYLEVKSVSMARGGIAAFPDAPTARGRRHLAELANLKTRGFSGTLLYFVTRSDARVVRPADEIDPGYGRALRHAVASGVKVVAVGARFGPRGVDFRGFLDVVME